MKLQNRLLFPLQINKTFIIILGLGLLLSGCTLAPQYQRPLIQSNIDLPTPNVNQETLLKAYQIGWENYFADPQLKSLIEIGLKNNYQVQTAILNLKKANAQYGLNIYNLIPNLTFSGIDKTRSGPLDNSSKSIIQQNYRSGLGVTRFELDVYSKFDQGQAHGHALKATHYDKMSADITFINSVAKKYFETRTNEMTLQNAQQSLKYQKELYKIQKLRHQAGIISTLELLNHQNQLDLAQSVYLDAQETYTNSINNLSILIGQPIPKDLPEKLPLTQQFTYTSLPKDISSEVILYRPDIRRAEEQLKQSNAQIGVARAAFFPKITLNGSINTSSVHFDDLFKKNNMTWGAGPGIYIPLFDIFPNLKNLKKAKIEKEQMILNYHYTVQRAFEEVAMAINTFNKLTTQYNLNYQIMVNSQKARDLTRLKFNQGIADKNEMLDAEKRLIESQNSFLRTQLLKLSNQVDLYTSLGGGVNKYNPQPHDDGHTNKKNYRQ